MKQLKELLKLTKECTLIYNSKRNREEFNSSLESDKLEIQLLWDEINKRKQLKEKIQKEMGFIIPNYIIDELVENKNNMSYSNLFCLINMAIINNRMSKYNAKKLKAYVTKNIKQKKYSMLFRN